MGQPRTADWPNRKLRTSNSAPIKNMSDLEIFASEDPDDYEIVDGEEHATRLLPPRSAQPGSVLAYLRVLSKWKFHKTDVDPWPSRLHGHHSSLPLKLDAITGNIFNVHTRRCVQRLRRKELVRIHVVLLASKDFAEKASVLLDTGA
jgi:hypothetical protein